MKILQRTAQYFRGKRAEYGFQQRCKDTGLTPWPVARGANSPYKFGVTLNWSPNNKSYVVDKEAKLVLFAANAVAEQFGLERLVTQPTLAAGGALVMYVGFKQN